MEHCHVFFFFFATFVELIFLPLLMDSGLRLISLSVQIRLIFPSSRLIF